MIDYDDSGRENQVSRSLPHNADAAVSHAWAAQRPGGLRSEAELRVQTRQAQRLVTGRAEKEGKNRIIGLVRFAMIIRRLWNSASLDDPYADWYLMVTLENLEHAREELVRLQQGVEQKLHRVNGVDIAVAESLEPVRFPLQFPNPYGYMGAYLVADFDDLARTILTARHVGLMDRDSAERMLYQGGRLVRRVFESTQGWKHSGVTRDDMAANNAKARAAIEAMGELPQDVLSGQTRPRIGPGHRLAFLKPTQEEQEDPFARLNRVRQEAQQPDQSRTASGDGSS